MGSSGGKGGGGAGGGMNDYFGDVAGIICSGPIDRLCAILVDGKKVWPDTGSGLDRSGQPNPVQLTITGYGEAWLYWGTTTQTLDASGEFNLAAIGHPPYRRQAVLSLKKFLFGREKVSCPSIECIVRRTPVQSIVTGAAALLDADGQANPLAVLAELLTDPVFGLGLPTADIDSTSWQATADALLARSSATYISPVFDRPASARSLVDDLRGYFDGWFRADTAAKIVAGRFLHGEAAPTFDSTNTLTADDLLEEPSITSKGWSDTINEVAVKFQDETNAYKDSAFTLNSGYNRQLVGEPRQTNFERPHITRRAQIASLASEFLKLSAEPGFTATLVVRAPKGVAYPTGTILKFTHDLLGVDLICRVTERSEAAPPSERVTLKIEAERGVTATPVPLAATSTVVAQDTGVEALPRYYFAMPPAALFGESYLLTPLVARQKSATIGFRVNFKNDDISQFQDLGAQETFAVRGSVVAAYASTLGTPDDNSETLRITIDAATPTNDLARVTEALTEDEVRDDTLLLWLISASNPAQVEILSVRALRLVSGQWYAKVRRARGGTVAATFAAADTAWLIRRDDVRTYSHSRFPALADSATAITFRLQAIGFGGVEADLSDTGLCPNLIVVLRPGATAAPSSVTALGIYQGVRLRWTNASGEVSVDIYEATTASPSPTASTAATANTFGSEFVRHGLTPATTYYYWLRSVDVSGGRGSWTAPVSAVAQSVDVGVISGTQIADDSISTPKLQANSITAAKVGTNEIISTSANIGNLVVSTIKIANNAVTVPSGVYTEGSIAGVIGSSVTIQTLTVVCSGAPVNLLGTWDGTFFWTGGGSPQDAPVDIKRGSTTITTSTRGVISLVDTPSAGTHTYTLVGRSQAAGGANYPNHFYARRALVITELKK